MKKHLDSPKSSAGSLTRGLLVLECFSPQKDSFTLSDLAKLLVIPKSSLHRVMKTLSRMNYLRYEEQSKRYYLGMRVLSLGFSVLQSMELREIARPYLEKLSRECNKTLNLAVLDRD
ncbi:MAG: IclR family transcriptional regulator, partial [Syntrophales bacterium]